MVTLLMVLLFVCLLAAFPLFVGLIFAPLAVAIIYFPDLSLELVVQQIIGGITPFALLAIPMFVLAADIMCMGQSARRLLNFIDSFVGHIWGGLVITAEATCTLFGAISGSAMATMVAVGKTMRPTLQSSGYKDSHIIPMIVTCSNIAFLIPPSIIMIMYCVVTGASVSELFIAGVIPGLALFALFAIYDYFYAKKNNIPRRPKATWAMRFKCFKEALLTLGLPVIILGGIYTGFASPTEAAALSVAYALLLEVVVYKSISVKELPKICYSTAIVTATVFILIAGGQMFSWVITYANIPNMLTESVLGTGSSALYILTITSLFFFIACMFVDCVPVILILVPMIYPLAVAAGIDPIHLGILVTVQSGIGSITPPFGANIFTACVIFDKKFMDIVKGLTPYLLLFFIFAILVVLFPQISLAHRYLGL